MHLIEGKVSDLVKTLALSFKKNEMHPAFSSLLHSNVTSNILALMSLMKDEQRHFRPLLYGERLAFNASITQALSVCF